MIYADGVKDGQNILVGYYEGKFLFNGNRNDLLELEMKELLRRRYSIGGTFYPKVNDIRNIINVIENHFFDLPVNAEVTGETVEDIPCESGRVY